MTTAHTSETKAVDDCSERFAPDWDQVPFDVACGRCGHDLRGRTEPTCPGCALSFEWAEAVPIEKLTCAQCAYNLYGLSETRCPECGSGFEWSEALARYHRTRLPYFEYRWRDRPVRSFFGTWARALRPSQFWRNINLHDPPRAAALILMTALFVALFLGAITIGTTLIDVCDEYMGTSSWRGPVTLMQFLTANLAWVIQLLLRNLAGCSVALTFYSAWLFFSLASLLIFQQSMRRFRVRKTQVLRAWAYAVPMTAPLFVGLGSILDASWIMVSYQSWTWNRHNVPVVGLTCTALMLMHTCWSLRCAYRWYLGIPHAMGVAIASQVIAVLLMMCVMVLGELS